MTAGQGFYQLVKGSVARMYDRNGYFRGYNDAENITAKDLARAVRIELVDGAKVTVLGEER